jgi:hypothetical protein
MTIQTNVLNTTVLGNGTTTVFPFTFPITKPEDLKVIHIASDGSETTLSLGNGSTNYLINIDDYPTPGSIQYPATGNNYLPNGEKLFITRDVAIEQLTDLANQGTWKPEVIEKALDYLTMIAMQIDDATKRTLLFPETSTLRSILLPKTLTAGTVLKVNSNADGLETGATANEISNANTYALSAQSSANTSALKATEAQNFRNEAQNFRNESQNIANSISGKTILSYNQNTSYQLNSIIEYNNSLYKVINSTFSIPSNNPDINTTNFQSISGSIELLDEDNMVSDSDTQAPSQQSVKAYVDGAIDSVNGADDVFNLQPLQTLGAISTQAGAIAKGFILLNGSTINISGYTQTQKDKLHSLVTGDYANIKTAYTQNSSITTINANAYFARVDSGRSLGNLQGDEFKSHTHSTPILARNYTLGSSNAYSYHGINNYGGITSSATGGSETRPKNINIAKHWGLYIGH